MVQIQTLLFVLVSLVYTVLCDAQECSCEEVPIGQTCPCHFEELLLWYKQQDAYIAPLEFKNGGFWALQDISNGSVLVEAPESLMLKPENPGANPTADAVALANLLHNARADPTHKYHSYARFLQPVCQLSFCGAPIPGGVSKSYYYEAEWDQGARNLVPEHLHNDLSLVLSRKWSTGMIPVFDCFNHDDTKGAALEQTEGRLRLRAGADYKAGEQVFINYGHHTSSVWLMYYNMHHTSGADTCTDALRIRSTLHMDVQRYACYRDDKTHNFEQVANATLHAMEVKDLAALKGLAEWLDTHLVVV